MLIIKDSIKTIILSLAMLAFIGIAHAWTEPSQNPPSGNTLAPVDTSVNTQYKPGLLSAEYLSSYADSYFATSSGNVWVGSTTGAPLTSKLEVNGDIGTYSRGQKINLVNSDVGLNRPSGTDNLELRSYIGDFLFKNVRDNKNVVVISNGNVGISTTDTPSTKLEVGGQIKSTSGGFVFPDGTTQATASSGAGGIGGGGTANYISKWIGGSSLGNSQVFDNGTNIGIGTASPSTKLHVSGQIRATGGTGIYSCPNQQGECGASRCIGQLSTSSTCEYGSYGNSCISTCMCSYVATSCTLVGRLVAP